MILLRKAREQDLPIIIELAEKIWPQTYSAYLSQTQLRYMLDLMYSEGELRSQMRDGHVFLMASEENREVGFAGFSLTDAENSIYKLHKIYVLPEFHGKGVGKILMNEVVNLIKHNGGKALQLNVNRNNNAKDFYLKAGFIVTETVDLDIGSGFFMNDYVMEKKLVG